MNSIEKLSKVRLNIQLTKKCNQRCVSCNSYKMNCEDEMKTEEIVNVITEIFGGGYEIKNVAFTGGEPTIHKDILKIASVAAEYATNVSITTNGYYFQSRKKMEELLQAGINRFSFSYHGIGKQDAFANTHGAEQRLRNAIEWICEEKRKNEKIYAKVGMLFDGSNINDIEEMLNYVEEKGLDLYIEIVDFHIPIFKESKLSAGIKIQLKDILEAVEKLNKWVADGRRINLDERGIQFIQKYYMDMPIRGMCPLGLTDIYIESNGDVRTGCWSLPAVGNIRERSITQILESEEYKLNVDKMLRRECSGCTCGYLMQSKYMDD